LSELFDSVWFIDTVQSDGKVSHDYINNKKTASEFDRVIAKIDLCLFCVLVMC